MALVRLEPLMVARPSRAWRPGTGMPAASRACGAGHAFALEEGLAFAHHQEGDLAHGREIAAGADRALFADHRGDPGIEHGDQGLGDLGSAARVAVGVDVGSQQHGAADPVLGAGFADPGGVVVDQVFLKLADLLVIQDDLGELADAGVDAVHDLARRDPLFEKRTAVNDPCAGIGVKFDLFAVAGDGHDVLDREVLAGDGDGHERLQKFEAVAPHPAERKIGVGGGE